MDNSNDSIDVYEHLATVLEATPQGFPRMKSGVNNCSSLCSLPRRFHLHVT